jgi:hypothetical protein
VIKASLISTPKHLAIFLASIGEGFLFPLKTVDKYGVVTPTLSLSDFNEYPLKAIAEYNAEVSLTNRVAIFSPPFLLIN